MRDFVLALQSRYTIIAERHQLPGVFQRRPNHVPQSCSLRCHCHYFCFGHFLLWRQVRPEKGYAKGCVGAFACIFQALGIVYVRSHNFSTQSCEMLCPGPIHIPSEHTRSETTIRVVKDRPDQTTDLGIGAPTTAITFLSLIVTSFSSSRRLHRGYVSYDDTVSKSRQRSGVVSISLASGRNFRHFSLGDVGRVRNSVLGLCSHNGHRRGLRIDSFSVSFWVQRRKSLDHDHDESRETRESQELCLRSSAERI